MCKVTTNIVYCGFDCHECLIYKATLKADTEYKEFVRSKYSSKDYTLRLEDINCTGCYKDSEKLFKFCKECEIRICGIAKDIDNCGECDNYPCEKLEKAFKVDPNNKINLDRFSNNFK